MQSGADAIAVTAPAFLADWLSRREPDERAEPFTFVVTLNGSLRLAPRRSEHVALAAGDAVLAAGEMTFEPEGAGWRVAEVTNQSTGFCPDPDSWPAVAAALDRIGVPMIGSSAVCWDVVRRARVRCRQTRLAAGSDAL